MIGDGSSASSADSSQTPTSNMKPSTSSCVSDGDGIKEAAKREFWGRLWRTRENNILSSMMEAGVWVDD